MRRSRPVGRPRKKPSLIRAHKNQNTKIPIEGKQRQEAGVASHPNLHAPALIDKVSRMSRNKVSRMSWNLTLKHAPPMRRSATEMAELRWQARAPASCSARHVWPVDFLRFVANKGVRRRPGENSGQTCLNS